MRRARSASCMLTPKRAACVFLPLVFSLVTAGCRTGARPVTIALPAAAVHPTPTAPTVTPPQERPDMEWWRRSMQTRDARVGWWRQARFGMFIHWGVYSQLAGVWEG